MKVQPHQRIVIGNHRKKTNAEKPVYVFDSQKVKPPQSGDAGWWAKHSQAKTQKEFYAELAKRYPA
jgi:hypothetical protein